MDAQQEIVADRQTTEPRHGPETAAALPRGNVSRSLLSLLTAATAVVAMGVADDASAQSYPAAPIKVVVPWPAAGIVDTAARVVGERLSAELGQPIVVENKPGAGGAIGADAVAKAAPDGYTFLLTSSGLTMNAALGRKLPYDVVQDFVPIVRIANAPAVLVTSQALNVKTVNDLVALAKSKAGELTFASAGNGSPAHFAAELFRERTGIDAIHIPYKGAPAAMNDQIAGRVTFHFANLPVALPHVKAGTIRALAITSLTRSPLLPDTATMEEAGYPNFQASQWLGYLAPRGTSEAVVKRFAAAVEKALADDGVKAALSRQGMEVVGTSSPTAFSAFVHADLKHWTQVVKSANIKVE